MDDELALGEPDTDPGAEARARVLPLQIGGAAVYVESGEEHCRRALGIFDEIGERLRAAESLEALAVIAAASQRPRRAVRLFAAAAGVRDKGGAVLPAVMRREYGAFMDEAREKLGGEAYRLEEDTGRRMSLREAIAGA